jgi:hypothetical protein
MALHEREIVAVVGVVALCACGGSVVAHAGDGTTETGGSSQMDASAESGGTSVLDARHDATGPCTAGTVTLRLMAPPGSESLFCAPNCGMDYLTVTDSSGQTYTVGAGCTTYCDSCTPVPCIMCPASGVMTPQGRSFDWDGSYFVSSTCGKQSTCAEHHCAQPGTYQVAMCTAPNASPNSALPYCERAEPAVCRTVSFDYPGAGVVTVWLGGIK